MSEIEFFPDGPPLWLLILIAVCAVLAIVGEERGRRTLVYVFKPLTTILVLLLALMGGSVDLPPSYRLLIVIGLLFSLAGDVLLMLPKDRFVAGLVSFLVAHLFYIAALARGGVRLTWWIALAFAVYAAALLRVLLPHVGRLKAPVIVYAAALTVMAWLAVERAILDIPGATLAAAGAVLFVASDSALAVDRFVRRIAHAPVVVLGTYFAAQTLIALSTWPPRP